MLKLTIAAMVMSLCAISVAAQKDKTWGEWTKKDVDKVLNDSAWGQTQTDSDTSQMFYSPTSDPNISRKTSNDSSRMGQGATNSDVHLNYRIRFFSAKPIRQAFARSILLRQATPSKEAVAQMSAWADQHSDDWIIVAVAYDSTDQRYLNPAIQAFSTVTTDLAKNSTYLERKDGKRIFLSEYAQPGTDGTGAKFVFPRNVDGHPFLSADSGEVRFHSDFVAGTNTIKLDRRFKVADMVYDGKLEY